LFYHSRMHSDSAPALEVFFSYSHRDEELRDQLETHLALLKREGELRTWHDRRIGAGREWQGEIDSRLESADLILLLISPDFIASDYCFDREMTLALERHAAGEARVIPIILRPADWQTARFARLQALPTGGEAITSWPDRDAAFVDVVRGIRAAIRELRGRRQPGPSPVVGASPAPEPSPVGRRWWPLVAAGLLAAAAIVAYLAIEGDGRAEPSVAEVERIFAGEQTSTEVLGRLALRLIDGRSAGGSRVGFDHRFATGDYFRFEVTSSRDGWLYVYHRPPGGRLDLLWPARDEIEANAVRALVPALIPAGEDALRFDGDIGEEYFYVALAPAPTASPTIREVEERRGRIESLIADGRHGSAVAGQRRGVVVARPDESPYLYFATTGVADTAAVELQLQHGQ
jgi:TIR domain/Domain of unknown function (DUF4384)